MLVIFVIRTRNNPFQNRLNLALARVSLTVVAVLLFTPFAAYLGFVAPPPRFYLNIVGDGVGLPADAVVMAKQPFYRYYSVQ